MIRISLSQRVFLFFLTLTAMVFMVAVTVYFGLDTLEGTSDRIGKVKDFRLQVQVLETFHTIPESPAVPAAKAAGYTPFEAEIDRAQVLAREVAREHRDIGPALAKRLTTLRASLGYYRNATRELQERFRRDAEFTAEMPVVAKATFERIGAQPSRKRGELRELFSRLLVLRGNTYHRRDLTSIAEMKVLVERMARLIEDPEIADTLHGFVKRTEANYLNYLGMKDRDAFLHKTSKRLFEVADQTVAALTQGLVDARRRLIGKVYGLILLSVVLTFSLWYLVTGYFRRFLGQQENAIRAIRAGEYDYPAERTSNDELGDLGLFLKNLALDLKESRDHIDRLLASTAEAIYGLDLNGNCTFANAACARMLGYGSEQELLGQHMHSLMHHSRPDGMAYPEAECAACRAYLKGIKTHADDEYFWRADDTGFSVEFWSSPIERDGRSVGAVVTFFDISRRLAAETALQESQERLQSIVDNSPTVIFLKDMAGRYLLANRRFQELVHASSDKIIGNTDYDLFPKPAADTYMASDKAVIEARAHREFEESVPQPDGARTYVAIKFPLLGPDGAPQAVCGIATDVTERRRTEEALRRSQKMEAIGQLAGGIAHDFNNLLGIVIGNLELLQDERESDDVSRRRLDGALKASLRGADLTKRLLAFSRRAVPETSPLSVNQVIESMRDMIDRALTAAITIEMDLADGIWRTEINPDELEDSLVNLAINARDAMPRGGRLRVETGNVVLDEVMVQEREGVSAGEYVTIAVSDTGVGIPEAQREHIFEPFFSTKPQGRGTGLGLSMVYGFVRRAGGDIRVESEPGRGTTFRLYLRRSAAVGVPDGAAAAPEREAPRGFETVLVVDDEQELAMLANGSLSRLGYRVLVAGTADEALETLATHPGVDLLFTDVVMPGGMDGLALAQQATRRYPGLKVLLASGFTQHARDSEYGAFTKNILSKPYRPSELAVRVREILDKEG